MISQVIDRIRTFHHRVTHGGGGDYCPTCDTDVEHSHAVRTLQDMNRELERKIEREGGRDVLKNMVLNREAPSHEHHR